MTDTHVEGLIIDKFLEAASLEIISKCYKYYQDNKEAEETLSAFDYWKPVYPAGSTEEDKAKIDGPLFYFNEDSLVNWYGYDYPNDYKTERGTVEKDALYEAIKSVVITRDPDEEVQRKIELYNPETEEMEYIHIYPVVFENLVSERDEVSDGYHKAWYELYFHSNPPETGELYRGSKKWYTGFLQINICVPKNMGTQDIKLRYNEIVELFKKHYLADSVRIERVYRDSIISEEDFSWCPVTIDWKAYLK